MADLTAMLQAAAGAGGEYQISRSLRFNSADSASLTRTPASASNRKTWTWSGWVKGPGNGNAAWFGAGTSGAQRSQFGPLASNNALIYFENSGSGTEAYVTTNAFFRDPSAWYHFVIAFDTTQATNTDRIKLYVNGIQQTIASGATWPSQNYDSCVNNNVVQRIGSYINADFESGYLADVHFIDGQALTPSSFGEVDATTGVWKPIRYTGTYGTNGFHLDFSDNTSTTTLGYDAAGSNDWTLNNFSVTAGAGNDSLVDSPTQYGTDTGAGGEVRGNYATLNPLATVAIAGTVTLSNGNLEIGNSLAADQFVSRATIGVSSGKWYWEVTDASLAARLVIGIIDVTALYNAAVSDAGSNGYGYFSLDGSKFVNGVNTAYGAAYASGDVIGFALDLDAGTLVCYKNNVSQGTLASGLSGTFTPALSERSSSGNTVAAIFNFGQRPFAYTAPSGFKALCTTNLPDPTVVQGDDYFNTVLYTGTGASQSITGVGFQPDFVWIKERSGAADHALYDAVRGVQQQLESNTTTDETTESTGLTAFGSDGFTVGSLAQVNTNTDTYVAWNWKESTVSKFDIVTYTGNGTARTISHNLGVVPNMIIVKARTTASTDQGWPVYHSANTANPETDYLLLNSTAATADLDTVWNDTAPTSSVFSVGTNALVNANNDTYVAYLFANVAGYSAFGSYTGNGSTDGPDFRRTRPDPDD